MPELRVKNSGDVAVLILDGEELVGAKQNRSVNVTILVPPQSEIVIPVSCIEAGRWGYSRPGFAAAGRVLNQEIRYRKADAVTRSLKQRRHRFSDQRAVWDGVGKTLYALGAASPTSALSDGFDSRANAITDYLAAFKLEPGQIGVIYRIGGVLAGLDLFGSETVFACAFPKLLRGSALQALAGFDKDGGSPLSDDRVFVHAVLSSQHWIVSQLSGLARNCAFDTAEIGGGALELDGALVHLFAFRRRPETDRAWERRH